MSKFKYASVGTVSHGTMRNQDLIPTFCEELRYLGHRSKELTKIESRVNRALYGRHGEDDAYFTDEVSSWDLESLFDMLNDHALPYMYFGAHVGDGSDYGFWVDYEYLDYDFFDGLKVNDLSEVPEKHTGEVLHINDHGNLALYSAKRGKLTEIWAIV